MASPASSRGLRPLLLAEDVLAYRYRLVRPVEVLDAQSGPAVLWLATDEVLARPVAAKVLSAGGRSGAAASKTFLTAAAAAGTVSHPVLARVYDAALEERPAERAGQPAGEIDVAYVISEWVTGRTLAEVLAADGPWQARQACALVTELADALSTAHAKGIAHGRIHPNNILMPDGRGVKLTDLAVAAALPHRAVPARRSGDPEPLAADVRDLTAVLYALLTAKWPASATPQPADGMPMAPTGKNGPSRGRLSSPSQVRAGIPRALDTVVVRALDPVAAREAPALTTPARLCDALERSVQPDRPQRGGAARALPRAAPAPRPAPRPAARPAPGPGTRAAGPAAYTPKPPVPRTFTPAPPAAPRAAPGARPYVAPSPGSVGAVPPELLRLLPIGLVLVLLLVIGVVSYSVGQRIGTVPNAPERDGAAGTAPTASPGGPRIAVGTPLDLIRAPVRDFDPPPGDGRERPGAVSNAHDGDRSTVWETERYTSELFGGTRPGVGLVVDLGEPTPVGRVELNMAAPGTVVELRVADTDETQSSGYRTLARGRSGPGVLTLTPSSIEPARYYLIWITSLAKVDEQFFAGVAEMRFYRG